MSTTEESGRFVIQSKADSLLGELSKDFADIVIQVASQMSTTRNSKGLPVITVCDIAGASEIMYGALRTAIDSGKIPKEGESLLEKIKIFCDKALSECKIDGGTPSRFGGPSSSAATD